MSSLKLTGSAVWRIQASHLVVFVALPLAIAGIRLFFGVVLLPFLLIGFGQTHVGAAQEIAHLRQPGCWIALAPCSLADRALWPLKSSSQASLAVEESSTVEPFMPVPTSFTVRHAWFVAWLVWFVVFLIRRHQRSR
jgi:hypothetical protein